MRIYFFILILRNSLKILTGTKTAEITNKFKLYRFSKILQDFFKSIWVGHCYVIWLPYFATMQPNNITMYLTLGPWQPMNIHTIIIDSSYIDSQRI